MSVIILQHFGCTKIDARKCDSHDSMQYEKVVFFGIWCRMGERNLVTVVNIMYTSRNAGICGLIMKVRARYQHCDAEQVCGISKGLVSLCFYVFLGFGWYNTMQFEHY